MSKVSREIAEAEVNTWLDKKKVFPSVRETYKDSIELIVESICEGVLQYNSDDNTFTHTLLFPTNGDAPVKSLIYKPRLNDIMLRPHLKGVASNDADARLNAYVAALTDTAKGIISALDSADKKICLAIVVFFM